MKILPFSKTYDGKKVLDFPGIELEPGKIYGVIGANGSGKSTFAKILSGVLCGDRKGNYTEGINILHADEAETLHTERAEKIWSYKNTCNKVSRNCRELYFFSYTGKHKSCKKSNGQSK